MKNAIIVIFRKKMNVFLVILEVHLIGEIQRRGPCEVFHEFDRQVDRHTVLHAVLHVVEPSVFEEEAVRHADVVLGIGCIAEV